MSHLKDPIKWRAWPTWCEPSGAPRETCTPLNMANGSEVAAAVVRQVEAIGEGFGEAEMVVEILEPEKFAGRYLVEIERTCSTHGRKLVSSK